MRNLKAEYFWIFVRLGLGGIFVYASLYKIVSPGSFAHQIANFHMLPSIVINPMAIVMPWLQLLCGLGLIFKRNLMGSSLAIFAMLVVFQIAVASALIRGLDFSCGCFESGGSPATWLIFSRDTIICVFGGMYFFRLLTDKRNLTQGFWMAG